MRFSQVLLLTFLMFIGEATHRRILNLRCSKFKLPLYSLPQRLALFYIVFALLFKD